MSSPKIIEKTDPREIRRKLGLNQQQFWSKIGVTQSGGSRYESGRNMPRPVRELLRLVHVEQIDIQRIKREDMDVIEYLKSEESELFKTLKKSIFCPMHQKIFCFCPGSDMLGQSPYLRHSGVISWIRVMQHPRSLRPSKKTPVCAPSSLRCAPALARAPPTP